MAKLYQAKAQLLGGEPRAALVALSLDETVGTDVARANLSSTLSALEDLTGSLVASVRDPGCIHGLAP